MGKRKVTVVKAWEWIRVQPEPIRCRDLMEAMKIGEKSATHILARMKHQGLIVLAGRTHKARWTVIDPLRVVESKAGSHPKSLDNLRVNWVRTTGNSHPKYRNSGQWSYGTGLEHYWKLTPKSVATDLNRNSIDALRGEVCPKFTEAAD